MQQFSAPQRELVSSLAQPLGAIRGIRAVVLGGSYARGRAQPGSDIDLGLLYSEAAPLSMASVRALAEAVNDTAGPIVTSFYEWGPWVNGGAWLTIGSQVRRGVGGLGQVLRQADPPARVWATMSGMSDHPEPCPDCGTAPGKYHVLGCDVERCPYCGQQLISCPCLEEGAVAPLDDREPWSGEWPGLADCRRLGFWCRPVEGRGWVPCAGGAPEAQPDLNRLNGRDAVWDRGHQRWVRPS